MKKQLLFILTLLGFAISNAQVLEQTLLVDFGPDDGTNGNVTSNPDSNGNYWNNPTDSNSTATTLALVDDANGATGYSLDVNTDMFTNGILNGGLLAPDQALLGDFAINTATQDYFTSNGDLGEFLISGLNPAYGYRFSMFASRTGTATRTTQYVISGTNTDTGTLVTTGTGIGNGGYDGNNDTIYMSDYVFPDASGNIQINISRAAGAFCYINAMKVEAFSGLSVVNVTAITVSGSDISTNRGTSQLVATVLPANADEQGVTWSVDDDTLASITENGLLSARGNGVVMVTATTNEVGSSVSGTSSITISNQVEPSSDFLVDFGPNDVTNGNITINPDSNGNFWNNAVDPTIAAPAIDLIDKEGNTSSYSLTISDVDFSSNGGTSSGGLIAPEVSLLGEYAIDTATQDYFFNFNTTSRLVISNLEQTSAYSFNIFGSRNTTSTRISQYTINGFDENGSSTSIIGINQTSGAGIGQGTSSINGNDSNVYTSEMIYPNASGEITIDINAIAGGFAYINFMKIDEFTAATLSVNNFSNNQFKFSPNPVKDFLNFEIPQNILVETIEIYNITGSKVKSILNSKSINLNELSSGVYIAKVILKTGDSSNFKIVKE